MSADVTLDSTHVPDDSHQPDSTAEVSLRWWPAALLLAVIVALKGILYVFTSPPLGLLMASFFGPVVAAGLILIWWLFASRAGLKEKMIGLLGLIVIAGLAIALSDDTMKGMVTTLFQIPVGIIGFAVPLILLARVPGARLMVALLLAVVGFGVWDLLRIEGFSGRFSPELAWRWTKSHENEYLTSSDLKATSTDLANKNLETVSRGDAAWPDFRGKSRDGVVEGVELKENWDANPPQLVWKRLIGPGWSSFSVAGNRLFTQEQRNDNEAVVCLDAETGETLWAFEYPGRFWEVIGGAGPRATPTIGDNAVFALGADGQLVCLRPTTGEVVWQRNLKEDTKREPPMWGWSASPLLVDGQVIVYAGSQNLQGEKTDAENKSIVQDHAVLAFDAETGEPTWSAPSGNHSYSSPQLASFAGTKGVLLMSNQGLQFFDPASGESIWSHEWEIENYRALQPLVFGNSILIGASLGDGTRRITVRPKGDGWDISEDWTSLEIKPEFNDYVRYEENLYGFDGNIFASVNLIDGKRNWKRGRYGNGQVILLRQGGQLLVSSEQGEIVLVEATPDKLIEKGKFPAIEGKTWNHPVVVGDRLYIRNGQEAACYELPVASTTVADNQVTDVDGPSSNGPE